MKKDEIVTILRNEKQFLKDNYGVEAIALFGSFAKGLEKVDNDVDFFVEFKNPSHSF